MDDATLDRFAELLVGFAANVQPGQIVAVGSEIGKEPLTRAIAASAYRRGAKFVDVAYFDLHVKRARASSTAARTRWTTSRRGIGERLLALGEQRCARIALDRPGRAGPARRPRPRARRRATSCRRCARPARWSTTARRTGRSVPVPDRGLGGARASRTSPDDGLAKLWRADRPRLPPRRGRSRSPPGASAPATLVGAAERLTARALRRAALRGPGHRPDRRPAAVAPAGWRRASRRVDGIPHVPNLPSEEVFTTPDPTRVDGVVRATKPLRSAGRSSAA